MPRLPIPLLVGALLSALLLAPGWRSLRPPAYPTVKLKPSSRVRVRRAIRPIRLPGVPAIPSQAGRSWSAR